MFEESKLVPREALVGLKERERESALVIVKTSLVVKFIVLSSFARRQATPTRHSS